jgi:hypothetical protein
VDGYLFNLDPAKTVKNIILPANPNVIVMAIDLASDTATAPLAAYYNRAGIYTDGTTFTNPATGGLDGGGYALSGTLLGASQIWTNTIFSFGPLNATNVVSCANQIITLPGGNYSRLRMLGTAVNGNQPAQSFLVTYTDATTTTFSQGMSDWFSPQNYSGEFKAVPMGYRNSSNGSSSENNSIYLYGYSFALNPAKTIQSVRLPNNANALITAISLVPNWPPIFSASSYILAGANAGVPYSGTIAASASDLNGDSLTFAKVSGPAWLTVAATGNLSGTPSNSDANTNVFIVSVRDSGGLSNTASLFIYVNAAPYFVNNPFSLPDSVAGQIYTGTISTNAIDPNPSDVLTFAKVSGPAWLSLGSDGTLSGTPLSADVGTNSFVVSVFDPSSLSDTANMTIFIQSAAPLVSGISFQGNDLLLSWSGGVGPYQVQTATNIDSPTWLNLGAPTNGDNLVISPTNDVSFYRIQGR